MNNNEPIDIKKALATDILMMMAGTFDLWFPNDPPADELVDSAHLAAEGIADKLAAALANASELSEASWDQMVADATRDAIMEVPAGGPLVKLARNKSFSAAVALCTAGIVAPAGSDWARAVAAERDAKMRKSLVKHGFSPQDAEQAIAQLRNSLANHHRSPSMKEEHHTTHTAAKPTKYWLVRFATSNIGCFADERTLTSQGIVEAPDIKTAEHEALIYHAEEGFSDETPYEPINSDEGKWVFFNDCRAFELSDRHCDVDARSILWIEFIQEVNAADAKILKKYLDHDPTDAEMKAQYRLRGVK